jgi:phage terminase large subunit-like protein
MHEPKNYIAEYIHEIESRRIRVSKKVKKVYLEWFKPIINDENPKYYFNPVPGSKYIEFAETFCKQSKGEWTGEPLEFMLFQKAKWQAIFGILHRETNKRRFKEVFTVEGRKNGKTTEHAPLVLWATLIEKGAEVYAAATVTSQAMRVIQEAISMIEQDNDLAGIFNYRLSPPLTIKLKRSASYARALSSNVKTFDGLNVSTAIIDEVHELPRSIYDILKQATSVREETLISMITTAGFVRGGLYDDIYDHAINVLEGISPDDTFLPLIYELDSESEISDPKCWPKANPSLGVIKKWEYLTEQVQRMQSDRNVSNTVKAKDFNLRGVENKAWLSYDDIHVVDQDGKAIVYTEEQLKKFDNTWVLGGFDLSRTGDMTAFNTLLFDKEKRRPIAITMYWITAKFYNERIADKKNKIPWQSWVERGLVRISGTELINYHDVANYVTDNFKDRGWMYQFINYDSYSANYLIEEFVQRGYQRDTCLIATQQGYKTLSVPMQLLSAHLIENILCYQNNPVTKWCFTNIELETDRNGNWMPKKLNDQRERKIDGAATILNCYVALSKNVDNYLE